ncbi:sensor of ECF-type sigma factor [Lacinutrix sp. C3R15]|uniref:sensor of ECF-type sigma factor n=1 Tax=Flavobacteriaceae TaxID=49546 RepID=UPI001C0A3E72|nr:MULTISPECIES: sensor of ECF-type sigma factor [Flavobacteriaceae]MBU2938899.1 sensor of ECF-type sigma factor [Lacinutrix sp. C3R15]MDO6622212.1 sensor of ECF-type sigma factor [Oceanihabitans sp. 1_MG-2023]
MKKTIITFFALFLTITTFSQDKLDKDKIKTLKVAYITENLELSTNEAQKFWPIYNTFEEEQDRLRNTAHALRKSPNIEALTEAEAKDLLEKMKNNNIKRIQLYNSYLQELQTVLTAKKIIKLKETEDNFRKKMFEEYKKRRQQNKE